MGTCDRIEMAFNTGMYGPPGFGGHPGLYGHPARGHHAVHHTLARPEPQLIVESNDTFSLREESANLQAQIQAMRIMHAQEVADLKLLLKNQPKPQAPKQAPSLIPEGFEFGRRVYQCTQAPPGVGYRFVPDFAQKNSDGR